MERFEQGNWQLLENDTIDSWCYYKSDIIDRIIEIIDPEHTLNKYEFEGEKLSLNEIKYKLEGISEEDFYTALDDIIYFTNYDGDIKLYNISDENESEFLKDDETFYYDFD